MENSQFDRLTRTLAAGASRRGVMRGLAAGLAASAAGGAAIADSSAKRKRPNKPNKPNKKKCKPGQVVAQVSVPATGGTATTPVLKNGQRYRLRATGFWATNAQYGNDAFAAFPFNNPNAPETTYQGVRLGLSVDGGSPDEWGSYTPSHTYERMVTGQGRSLQLRFSDKGYEDNSGTLTVEVSCA